MSLLQPSSNSRVAFLEKNAAPSSSKLMSCFPRQNKCNILKQSKHSTLAESDRGVFLQHSVRLINADPDYWNGNWYVACPCLHAEKLELQKSLSTARSTLIQSHVFFFPRPVGGVGNSCAELINSELVPFQLLVTPTDEGLGEFLSRFGVKYFSLCKHFNRDFKNQQCPKQSPGIW